MEPTKARRLGGDKPRHTVVVVTKAMSARNSVEVVNTIVVIAEADELRMRRLKF